MLRFRPLIACLAIAWSLAITHLHAQTTTTENTTDFVTTWTITGTTEEERSITFPGEGSYTIDWGDGMSETVTDATSTSIDHASAGEYTNTTYTDSGLTAGGGTTYRYRVSAINSVRTGTASTEVSATIGATNPDTPALSGATFTSATSITIEVSEAIVAPTTNGSGFTIANAISGGTGLTVTAAAYNTSTNLITLTTSAAVDGESYVITHPDIVDTASDANTLSGTALAAIQISGR